MPRMVVAVLAVAVALGSLSAVTPATATPSEQITATCEGMGEVRVTVSSGAAFWIGDALYLPLTFRASSGGQTVFEKSYGNRSGLTDTINCGTEPNEFGFEFEVTAVRVPPAR